MSLSIMIEDCKGLKPLYDRAHGQRTIVLGTSDDEIMVLEIPKGKTEVLVPLHKVSSETFCGMGDVIWAARKARFKTAVVVFSSCLKKIGIIAME